MSNGGSAVERLRAAARARALAEAEEAAAIAALAVEHGWTGEACYDVVGTRPVRLGADGTALFDEFVALEVAAAKGISVAAATWLVRDIVNLQARHPRLWHQALQGRLPVFRACQLTAEMAEYDLTAAEAGEVDDLLAPKVGGVPWRRLLQRCRGLITTVAPGKARAATQRARVDRFVRKEATRDASVALITARVDTADAIFFDGMVDRIADLLGAQGDEDPKEIRRAKALGILATPSRANLMLREAVGLVGEVRADDPKLLPEAEVFVHIAEDSLLLGRGPARVEGHGPLEATLLGCLLGHHRVRVTPVIRPFAETSADSYEIPAGMRRQVLARDVFEVFPFSARSSRRQDLDHTIPFVPGVPGQTRPDNLGPLSRKAHRAKTHGGWGLAQPRPGVFHWTTPSGHRYRVTQHGTTTSPDTDVGGRLFDILWDAEERERDADAER